MSKDIEILPLATEMEVNKIRKIARMQIYKQILREIKSARRENILNEADLGVGEYNVSGYTVEDQKEKEKEAVDVLDASADAIYAGALGQFIAAANAQDRLGGLVDTLVSLTTFPVTDDELIEIYGIICNLVEKDRPDLLYTKTTSALYSYANESFFEFVVNTFNPADPFNLAALALAPFTGGTSLAGPAAFKAALSSSGRASSRAAIKQAVKQGAKKGFRKAAAPGRGLARDASRKTLKTAFRGAKQAITTGDVPTKLLSRVVEKHQINKQMFSDVLSGFDRQIVDSVSGAQKSVFEIMEEAITSPNGVRFVDDSGQTIALDSFSTFDEFITSTFDDPNFLKQVMGLSDEAALEVADSLPRNPAFRKQLKRYYDDISENFNMYEEAVSPLTRKLASRGNETAAKVVREIGRYTPDISRGVIDFPRLSELFRRLVNRVSGGRLGTGRGLGRTVDAFGLTDDAAKRLLDDMFIQENLVGDVANSALETISKNSTKYSTGPITRIANAPQLRLFADVDGTVDMSRVGRKFRELLLESGGDYDVQNAIKIGPGRIEIKADLLKKLNPDIGDMPYATGSGRNGLVVIEPSTFSGVADAADFRLLAEDMSQMKRFLTSNIDYHKQYTKNIDFLTENMKNVGDKMLTKQLFTNYAVYGAQRGLGDYMLGQGFSDEETRRMAAEADRAGKESSFNEKAAERALQKYLTNGTRDLTDEELELIGLSDNPEEAYDDFMSDEDLDDLEYEGMSDLAAEQEKVDEEYYSGLLGVINNYDRYLNWWNGGGKDRLTQLEDAFSGGSQEMANDIGRINFLDMGYVEDIGTTVGDAVKSLANIIPGVDMDTNSRKVSVDGQSMKFTGAALDWLVGRLKEVLSGIVDGSLSQSDALEMLGVNGWLDVAGEADYAPSTSKLNKKHKSLIKKQIAQSASLVDTVEVGELEQLWKLYERMGQDLGQETALRESKNRSRKTVNDSVDSIHLTEEKLREVIKAALSSQYKNIKKKSVLSEDRGDSNSDTRFLEIQSKLVQSFNENKFEINADYEDIIKEVAAPANVAAKFNKQAGRASTSGIWHDWMMVHSVNYGGDSQNTNPVGVGIIFYKYDESGSPKWSDAGSVSVDLTEVWPWLTHPDDDIPGPLGLKQRSDPSGVWWLRAKRALENGGIPNVGDFGVDVNDYFNQAWKLLTEALLDEVTQLFAAAPFEPGAKILPIMYKAYGADISTPDTVITYTKQDNLSMWSKIQDMGPAMEDNRKFGRGKAATDFTFGNYVILSALFTNRDGTSMSSNLTDPTNFGKQIKDIISPDGAPMGEMTDSSHQAKVDSGGESGSGSASGDLLDQLSNLDKTSEKAREEFIDTIESRGRGGEGTFGLVVLSEPKRGARLINNWVTDISTASLFVKLGETEWLKKNARPVWDGFYSPYEKSRGAKINQNLGDWNEFQDAYIHIIGKALEAQRGIFLDPDVVDAYDTLDPGRKGWIFFRPKLVELGYDDYRPTSESKPINQGDMYDFAKFMRDLANEFRPDRGGKQAQRLTMEEEEALALEIMEKYKEVGHPKGVNDYSENLEEVLATVEENPFATRREIYKMVADDMGWGPPVAPAPAAGALEESKNRKRNVRVSRAFGRGKK